MSILLMTATINSGNFGNVRTQIKDTEERKRQYEEALYKYIVLSNFDKIVFAENSGESFDIQRFEKLAEEHGKMFEFLYLPGDKETMQIYGKSYGEAQLISDALCNSKLFDNEQVFYKVTGRIWISNINELIDNEVNSCFVAHNFVSWLLTSFFKVRIDDFLENLLNAKKFCNDFDDNDNCIEHVYFELMKKAKHKVKCFKKYPEFTGVVSGTGTAYKKSSGGIKLRNVLIRLKWYDMEIKTRWYYSLLLKTAIFVNKILYKIRTK